MVRPQPPGPEDVRHIGKHNLDFDERYAVRHNLSNIHIHGQLDDLLNKRDNFISFYDDQHHNVHLNNQHLLVHILKGRIFIVPKSKTTA